MSAQIAAGSKPTLAVIEVTDPAAFARSGRQLTFMIAVDHVPISSIAEFEQINDDQARMVAAIQQNLRRPSGISTG